MWPFASGGWGQMILTELNPFASGGRIWPSTMTVMVLAEQLFGHACPHTPEEAPDKPARYRAANAIVASGAFWIDVVRPVMQRSGVPLPPPEFVSGAIRIG